MPEKTAAQKAIEKLKASGENGKGSRSAADKEGASSAKRKRNTYFLDGSIVSKDSSGIRNETLQWPGVAWNGKVYGKEGSRFIYLKNTETPVTDAEAASLSAVAESARSDGDLPWPGKGSWNGRFIETSEKDENGDPFWKIFLSRNQVLITDKQKASLLKCIRDGARALGKEPPLDSDDYARARNTDLYDFVLKTEPENWKVTGTSLHHRDMDSLTIYSRGRNWCERLSMSSSEKRSFNTLEYVMEFHDLSAKEAALYINDGGQYDKASERVERVEQKISFPEPALLPDGSADNGRVYSYLTGRGISKDTIDSLISQNLLYQEADSGNIVFKAMDERSYEMRGSVPGRKFHRNKPSLPTDMWLFKTGEGPVEKIYMCEGAIDAVSLHDLLLKKEGVEENALFCSMMGVGNQQRIDVVKSMKIVQSGRAQVVIATDNDEAGKDALDRNADCARIIPQGKDWNEDLQSGASLGDIIPSPEQTSKSRLFAEKLSEPDGQRAEAAADRSYDPGEFIDASGEDVPFPEDTETPVMRTDNETPLEAAGLQPITPAEMIKQDSFCKCAKSILDTVRVLKEEQLSGEAAVDKLKNETLKSTGKLFVEACGVSGRLERAANILEAYSYSGPASSSVSYQEMKRSPAFEALMQPVVYELGQSQIYAQIQSDALKKLSFASESNFILSSADIRNMYLLDSEIAGFKDFIANELISHDETPSVNPEELADGVPSVDEEEI